MAALQHAYQAGLSDQQVRACGRVKNILPDDMKGRRHQRFILTVADELSILIAHNIDLAARIDNLQVQDEVCFYGEYEWNKQGGVVHWTHHSPNNRHVHGWLTHEGRRYE
jgi:hypothetical protein